MIYPPFVPEQGCIGITALSSGIGDDPESYQRILNHLGESGFRVKATRNVLSPNPVSSTGRSRARQLSSLVRDPEVSLVLSAAGGDFFMEMLPYIDFEQLKAHPKWMEGMSDPSPLLYILPTMLDIASFYGINAGGFKSEVLQEHIKVHTDYWKGKITPQNSFSFCRKDITADKIHPVYPDPVYWKTPHGGVKTEGRMIGGCIDVLRDIAGTKWDHTAAFCEKYREEGILWYFDIFALSPEDFYHSLFHLQQCGWFAHVKGVILGRIAFPRRSSLISYQKAVEKVFGKEVPLVTEADTGHTAPQMIMINGAYTSLEAKEGKGTLRFTLK